MTLECIHAINARQLRLGKGAVCDNDILRRHVVAPVGANTPDLFLFVPYRGGDRGLEHGQLIEIVFTSDLTAMFPDFRPLGEVALGHVVQFIQQRDIIIRWRIACNTRIAVPVPGATDIGPAFHDADALNASLAHARRCQ